MSAFLHSLTPRVLFLKDTPKTFTENKGLLKKHCNLGFSSTLDQNTGFKQFTVLETNEIDLLTLQITFPCAFHYQQCYQSLTTLFMSIYYHNSLVPII